MNKIAAKVARRLQKQSSRPVVSLDSYRQARQAAQEAMATIRRPEALVEQGFHPAHATYVQVQNLLSVTVECLLEMPELDRFSKLLGDAEDEYMPGGPPMSSVTTSFFTLWASFDAAIGVRRETLTSIVLDLKHILKIPAEFVTPMEHFHRSRMGIYEHLGFDAENIQLRDMATGEVARVFNPTGYRGEPGEVWFVRLLPNLNEPRKDKIGFTTPYILVSGSADWRAFFRRGTWRTQKKAQSDEDLLKYGMSPWYWLEFIHQAYAGINAESSAIFLHGLPDIGHTRPHFSPSAVARLPETSYSTSL